MKNKLWKCSVSLMHNSNKNNHKVLPIFYVTASTYDDAKNGASKIVDAFPLNSGVIHAVILVAEVIGK